MFTKRAFGAKRNVDNGGGVKKAGLPGSVGIPTMLKRFVSKRSGILNTVSEKIWTLLRSLIGETTNSGLTPGFGYSVAINGDYIVVGAPFQDVPPNNDFGKAYVFKISTGYTLAATLTSGETNDSGLTPGFGYSVAINGDYIVVGAPNQDVSPDDDLGKAYVFKISNGVVPTTPTTTLTSGETTDGGYTPQFGYSVAINGDYIVVGAPFQDVSPDDDLGKAYVFKISNGVVPTTPTTTLTSGETNDSDFYPHFGYSVAINGDYIVVGAPNQDVPPNNDFGKAYVFKISTGYTLAATLTSGETNDSRLTPGFGYSVAINGDYIVVGAPFQDVVSPDDDLGKAYVFKNQ